MGPMCGELLALYIVMSSWSLLNLAFENSHSLPLLWHSLHPLFSLTSDVWLFSWKGYCFSETKVRRCCPNTGREWRYGSCLYNSPSLEYNYLLGCWMLYCACLSWCCYTMCLFGQPVDTLIGYTSLAVYYCSKYVWYEPVVLACKLCTSSDSLCLCV